MALSFTVTKEDMLRSKVLDPGWYQAIVKNVTQEKAKSDDGQSINTWVDFTVLAGPIQKDGTDPKDTPCRRCFSEKAPAFIVPFLKAAGATIQAGGGTYDVERARGIKMKIYVANRTWDGQVQNDVKDFQAIADPASA